MKQSESITKLLGAFTKAQAEFTTLPKDKQGYGYKYTDLDTVISAVRPILAKHGLGFMQTLTNLEGGKSAITTRLFSSEGEYLEDTIGLPDVAMAKTNSAQNLGASITYMKRYALCAMLGISSDEDTDAVVENKKTDTVANTKSPVKPFASKAANTQKVVQKNNTSALKGGDDTPEQHKEIENLLGAETEDGRAIFSVEEIAKIPSWRKQRTADEVINYLKGELKKRWTEKQEDKEIF